MQMMLNMKNKQQKQQRSHMFWYSLAGCWYICPAQLLPVVLSLLLQQCMLSNYGVCHRRNLLLIVRAHKIGSNNLKPVRLCVYY